MASNSVTRATSPKKDVTVNQAAISRTDLLSTLSNVIRQAEESRELLENIPCKKVGAVLSDQLDSKLEALRDEIAGLSEKVEVSGVVAEMMPEWDAAPSATKSRIPAQFMEAVNRRARELAAAQYSTIRDIIVDGVAVNMACKDGMVTDSYVLGYIECYGDLASDVSVVNTRDLQMLACDVGEAINRAGAAIVAIRDIERHAGRELYTRISLPSIPSHTRLVQEVIDRIDDGVDMAHEHIFSE